MGSCLVTQPLRETKLQPLSSVEASLCCREAGEKEWRVRWARWEGEREKRGPVPRALSIFFDYCYFYWDTQREHLRGRDLQPLLLCKTCSLSTFKKSSCERRDINNRLILESFNLLHTHVSVRPLGRAMGTGSTNH